ncbi:MAG: O-antigen translocase [Bacteroidales bacterium]|nr:O-antigen translocase [Bacteroidales bacterium]
MTEANNKEQLTSYKGIFKATSLFGGVQVYQILVSVVKSKFIAVLLGPLGVGIQGLYQSALLFVQSVTAMGLSSSAVRDVSEVNGSGDLSRVAIIVKTLRRLVWCTGLLGVMAVILFSPMLSETSFGDKKHIVPFIILSITLLIDQICAGQKVLLQGMRRLGQLAKASAIGSTLSLLVSVPLYYLYGIEGIVPTLILNSLTLLFLSWLYARHISLPPVKLTIKETILHGKGMLKMGFAMSWSSILVLGCAYALRWFIRSETGTEAVGLYTAGFTIINTYVGMIFTAIGTDYYPRLAAVNNDNKLTTATVNQQGEVAVLIMAPLLLICIIFMPIIVRILYSEQFLGANSFISIAAVGMIFKLGSWLIAFQFIAKGESKLFVINETITNIYFLLLNLIGYKLFGLSGLGISFTLSYLIYFIQVYLIAQKRYNYCFSNELKKIFFIQTVLLLICFGVSRFHFAFFLYPVGSILIIISLAYSIKELDNRMDLKSMVKRILKNNK